MLAKLNILILLLWPLFSVVLFGLIRPRRRAAMASLLIGMLFLPEAEIELAGLPNLDKNAIVGLGLLLAALGYDADRLTRFRPHWVDLFALAFVMAPVLNVSFADTLFPMPFQFGVASGLSFFLGLTGPYLIARLYIRDFTALRELALAIVIAGLVYVPVCLWEGRMSPQLHTKIYGFFPGASFSMSKRWGGFRPVGFTSDGLMLSILMAGTAIVAWAVWQGQSVRAFRFNKFAVHPFWVAWTLAATTVWCRSTGAIILLMMAIPVLWITRKFQTRLALIGFLLIPPIYMTVRLPELVSSQVILDLLSPILPEARLASLEFRLTQEDVLNEYTWQHLWLGRGGYGGLQVFDATTGRTAVNNDVVDATWMILSGKWGLFGLLGYYCMLMMPAILVAARIPKAYLRHPIIACVIGLTLVLGIRGIDALTNGFLSPIYMFLSGALLGVLPQFSRTQPKQQQVVHQTKRRELPWRKRPEPELIPDSPLLDRHGEEVVEVEPAVEVAPSHPTRVS